MSDAGDEAAILARAQSLYRLGDLAGAADHLVPLVEQPSPKAAALRLLGLCRLKLGEITDAVRLLRQAQALAPSDPWAQVHLALALLASGLPAEAASRLRVAAEALPTESAPLINLVAALLALHDFEGAVHAGREACRRSPDLPSPRYALGQALLASGELTLAEDAFRSVVDVAPRFTDAWVNLGVARYRAGRMGDARAAMARALDIDPLHCAAAANLAAFQRLSGQTDQAEALLRRVLAEAPEAMSLRLNLAGLLLQDERSTEALDLLGEAGPRAGHDRQAWALQRISALLNTGAGDQAAALMASLVALTPDLAPLGAWREVLLAVWRGEEDAARDAALRTEAALNAAGEALIPEHAIMTRFDLAKFWHVRGDTDRAFAGWREGHVRLSRFQPFSREAHRAVIDATIETFDRIGLRERPRATNRDPAPVFIVGMPRSGTTLCERILDAHPQAHGAGERIALGRLAHQLGGAATGVQAVHRIAALHQPTPDEAADAYLSDLHALAPDASRVVDKMPGNFLHLGLVARMLPGARVIHCTRDPRDIGFSIFTFRFHGQHGYAHDLADLGWYIAEQHRLMAHWKAVLPNPILTVGLSDWVEDFDATLARLLDFLDLPYDAACTRFYETEGRARTVSRRQVRQPINARGLGRWRPYAEHLRPLIEELERAGLC